MPPPGSAFVPVGQPAGPLRRRRDRPRRAGPQAQRLGLRLGEPDRGRGRLLCARLAGRRVPADLEPPGAPGPVRRHDREDAPVPLREPAYAKRGGAHLHPPLPRDRAVRRNGGPLRPGAQGAGRFAVVSQEPARRDRAGRPRRRLLPGHRVPSSALLRNDRHAGRLPAARRAGGRGRVDGGGAVCRAVRRTGAAAAQPARGGTQANRPGGGAVRRCRRPCQAARRPAAPLPGRGRSAGERKRPRASRSCRGHRVVARDDPGTRGRRADARTGGRASSRLVRGRRQGGAGHRGPVRDGSPQRASLGVRAAPGPPLRRRRSPSSCRRRFTPRAPPPF